MGCPGRKRPPSAKTQQGCCEGRSTKARFLRSLCPAEPLSPFLCISVFLLAPSPHYTPCVSLSPTLFLCLSVCLSLCPISSHVDTNTSEKNRRLGGRDLHHSLARQEQGDSVRIKSADTQSATETPAITCIWTSCKPLLEQRQLLMMQPGRRFGITRSEKLKSRAPCGGTREPTATGAQRVSRAVSHVPEPGPPPRGAPVQGQQRCARFRPGNVKEGTRLGYSFFCKSRGVGSAAQQGTLVMTSSSARNSGASFRPLANTMANTPCHVGTVRHQSHRMDRNSLCF